MSCWTRTARLFCLSLATVVFCQGSGASAQEAARPDWQVVKSSGEVWLTTSGVQPASLGNAEALKGGDSIRTGRTGRVLLARGQETILIAPNSIVSLPAKEAEGSATTILQRAGSILLEVDKRNVKNFEVETPYLVAAVKGTQFQVSVNRNDATVQVRRGEVEVADFKSGQLALVLPGQAAKVSAHGPGGLALTGSGVLSPIRRGEPRQPSVQAVPVPRAGLSAPRSAQGEHVRALGQLSRAGFAGEGAHARVRGQGALRIAVPLGEMRLNVHKATNGLARGTLTLPSATGRSTQQTVWGSGALTPGNGVGASYNVGNNGSGNGNGSANGTSGGNGNAGGTGNGNANGSANAGGNGNGNAFGLVNNPGGNGNNGNGNGNNGNGNGNNGNNGNPHGNPNGHPPHP
jgi:hypothetical protein